MKGLLIKDFLVIKKQIKWLLIVLFFIAVSGSANAAFIPMLAVMLPMTAMAYDEQSKWNELAAMMPYYKKNIVLSKYVIGYLPLAVFSVFAAVSQAAINAVRHKNLSSGLYMLLVFVILGLLLIAINLPIFFKYGVQKGRFIFILFMTLFLFVVPFLAVKSEIPADIFASASDAVIIEVIAVIFTAVLALNVFSVFLSLRIKNSR